MENSIIFAIELIGTIAFASSGAMLGIRKNLDIFGVVVLGLCVAVGGGIVRDIILAQRSPGSQLCADGVGDGGAFLRHRFLVAGNSHQPVYGDL